jgi:hypothetical protein
MAQTFYPITPVNVTPGTTGSWQDVACSSYIASGATGVVVHVLNTSLATTYIAKIRCNGSTDARQNGMNFDCHAWAAYGVDGSRIFEAYIGSSDVQVWLVGYTMTGVTFKTNGVSKTIGATSTWTDVDCTSDTSASAVAIIFEPFSFGYQVGVRKNGSSDALTEYANYPDNIQSAIIGCDDSQIVEVYTDYPGDTIFFLTGYVTDGVTMNTNGTDFTLHSPLDTWTDMTALSSDAVMGFIDYQASSDSIRSGFRKNGSAEDFAVRVYRHVWALVECDASHIIEAYTDTDGLNCKLVGYATQPTSSLSISLPLGFVSQS